MVHAIKDYKTTNFQIANTQQSKISTREISVYRMQHKLLVNSRREISIVQLAHTLVESVETAQWLFPICNQVNSSILIQQANVAIGSARKLRLTVDKKKQTVLLAECDQSFVQALCTLLSLPMATLVRLLEQDSTVEPTEGVKQPLGCFHSLYKSMSALDDTIFWQVQGAAVASPLLQDGQMPKVDGAVGWEPQLIELLHMP